jgi:uncharacterized protein YbaP (TraB family)
MRRFLLLLAAWLALPLAAQAQACPPPRPALDLVQMKAQARDRGMLWRLEKGGRVSWLYGTLHANRAEWAIPGPVVTQALQGSDTLAVELDMTDASVLQALLRGSTDPARVARVLDPGRTDRILRQSLKSCVPGALLHPLKPLLQVTTLAISEAAREGFYAELGVDLMLVSMARAAGKPVQSLETAEQQLAALTPASEEEERELVDKALQDIEAGRAGPQLQGLARVWAEGDEAALASYPAWCECARTPAERRLLTRINDERNPAIADKIAAMHQGGERVFAAVGLLHMAGGRPLPQLMRERGFSVERVRLQPGS